MAYFTPRRRPDETPHVPRGTRTGPLRAGHYFKHASSSNKVTAIVEANNYFNMPSILWNANTVLVPLIKMSYHVELGLAITQSTKFLDVCSGLGLLVTGVYTVACVHAALPSR